MNIANLICENEELKQENEALKLKLFWQEYGQDELNAAMRLANQVEGGIGCSCLACAVSGRHESEYGEIAENKPCTFKTWFEQVLREHDMSIGSVVNSGNNGLDDGHHFRNSVRQDWFCWTYGSKLWSATSVGDPELVKLERLFKTLDMVGWEDTGE
jgi:hypothetical protein